MAELEKLSIYGAGPGASGAAPPSEPAGDPIEEEDGASASRGLAGRFGAGSLRNIVTTVVVAAVIVGLVWFFDSPGGTVNSQSVTPTGAAAGPAPRVGKEAPDFKVRGLDGKTYQLSDFRGQPVWINFWATWCPPCRAENPDIEAVYGQYKDAGLVVLGLNMGEDDSTVKGYVERSGLTYTIGMDQTTDIAASYRIVGIPTHFFVDRDGILREIRIGGMSKKSMEKKIQSLVQPGAAK